MVDELNRTILGYESENIENNVVLWEMVGAYMGLLIDFFCYSLEDMLREPLLLAQSLM